MNEKRGWNKTQAVIACRAAHFTKQMLDIWAEYSVIIHRICCNSRLSLRRGAALGNSRRSLIRSTLERIFAVSCTLLCICAAWLCHVNMVLPWRWCHPLVFDSVHTCRQPWWISNTAAGWLNWSKSHSFFKSSISCSWSHLSMTKAIRLVFFCLPFVYY